MPNMMDYMYMRDMARRKSDMPRMGGMRDGRNPYGSRGGYITSRDPRRRDRAMEDYNYEREEPRRGMEDYGYHGEPSRQYYGAYGDVPFYVMEQRDYRRGMDYNYGRDYGYGYPDYAGGEVMSRQELETLHHKLLQEVEQGDRDNFSKEKILKRAGELGIKFDEFSPEALAVATLMVYTDYCKTLGKGNLDTYIRLAKDFMSDTDSELKGEEKLTAYFDYVVMPK